MRFPGFIVAVTLLLPACSFAANKEMAELQRDVAQLQDQLRTLQSTIDQKLGAIQALSQQSLEAGNRANTGVSVLSSSVNQTLERDIKQALAPVAALAAKVDNTNNDVSEVRNQVAELNNTVNKIYQLLNDMNNAIKVMQAPAAPPPSANPAGPTGASSNAVPPASALFANAERDYNGGKMDLAAEEYAVFIKAYPDDPNAAGAQLNIGGIHYTAGKLDLAVKDFDAVIERYSDNANVTPDAYFMKGMALKQSSRKAEAAATFRALIKNFPRSDKAKEATSQLRAMGFTAAVTPPPAPRRKR